LVNTLLPQLETLPVDLELVRLYYEPPGKSTEK
jgi:hypothetical protein